MGMKLNFLRRVQAKADRISPKSLHVVPLFRTMIQC